MADLPGGDTELSEWGPKIKPILHAFIDRTGWPCHLNLSKTFTRCNDMSASRPISDFVSLPWSTEGIVLKVIHQAKGETYDAVMVACGPGKGGTKGDLYQWLHPEDSGHDPQRTGYVAMTRPRKLLILAVPRGTSPELIQKLQPHFQVYSEDRE